MSEDRRLSLRFESKVDSVDAAELIAKGLAREAGFDDDVLDRLGMAVRETMVNAVTHGNGYSREKSVYFNVHVDTAGALTVVIRDEGEGFDPEEVPDPTSPDNLLKASGRGLLLMNALVDQATVRRGEPNGTEVVLVKHAPEGRSEKEDHS